MGNIFPLGNVMLEDPTIRVRDYFNTDLYQRFYESAGRVFESPQAHHSFQLRRVPQDIIGPHVPAEVSILAVMGNEDGVTEVIGVIDHLKA